MDACQGSHSRTSRKVTTQLRELELALIQKACRAGVLEKAGVSPLLKEREERGRN